MGEGQSGAEVTADGRSLPFAHDTSGWPLHGDFLQHILDTMADPLFVKDDAHRWILVNKAFCELMGQPRDDLLGKSDFDFFPPEEAEVFWAKDAEVFRDGGVNVNEEPFTDSDGLRHIIVTKKAVFEDAEGRKLLVGTIRDVTEFKRAEEELARAKDELELRVAQRTREVEEAHARLRQAQKMEAVGQLTGGVAHDFNNLLAVVSGTLDLIALRCKTDEKLSPLIARALEAVDKGATLTQRLLTFARKQSLRPRPTDVNALIGGMLDLLRRTLGERVRVVTQLEPDVLPALVDPALLETSLLNLCINARDAMPAGGAVTITTAPLQVHQEREGLSPGRYVLLEVTDTGVGIEPENQQRVFEPFYTTKPSGKGSGLGLSMVYGFVKQSRGQVSLISAPGRGTSLKLLLPEATEPATTPPPRDRDEALPLGSGQRILLVEDQLAVRELTEIMLESLGYRVSSAASTAEALALLPTLPELTLLLTDVVLGGPDGKELAAQVRAERPDLRVVYMSGFAENALAGVADDDLHLLHKPFRLSELATLLQTALT